MRLKGTDVKKEKEKRSVIKKEGNQGRLIDYDPFGAYCLLFREQ